MGAVGLLLDSDPGEENYMADQLLACLIQTTAHTPPEGAHRHVSTVKMVATNLLSEGRLWEGVQLLALTGQVSEAVSYLRSAGHWSIALWLARLRLSEEDFNALTSKYCDFLTNQGRVKEACKTHLLSGRNQAAIETLHLAQERGLAVRLRLNRPVGKSVTILESKLMGKVMAKVSKSLLKSRPGSLDV